MNFKCSSWVEEGRKPDIKVTASVPLDHEEKAKGSRKETPLLTGAMVAQMCDVRPGIGTRF